MRNFTKIRTIWTIGIDETSAQAISEIAGAGYSLQTWFHESLPDLTEPGGTQAPCLICFDIIACRAFMNLPYEQTAFLELVPKTLILDENASMEDLESAISLGVTDIIRLPLSKNRFTASLRKASESASLQRDIHNMAHEVFIVREMFDRKDKALSFLVSFLDTISGSLGTFELLQQTYACLQQLLPLTAMSAFIVTPGSENTATADLFIDAPYGSNAWNAWRDQLLEMARKTIDGRDIISRELFLPLRATGIPHSPSDGHLLTLSARVGNDAMFSLILLTGMRSNLSRDQAHALDSALKYLALCMDKALNIPLPGVSEGLSIVATPLARA